ncbi:MAG TPA: translocation/assembly module TamB domain-containing protein [Salinimicrobium sp.]|nr:translocation/assembly module TamB domain-containing protein [Salinimicrobium sp.]
MEDVTLLADNFYLKDAAAGVYLEKFVFREASGLNLNQFSGNLELNDEKLALNDLNFQLNDNSLAGNMILEYNSISDLMEHPENTRINANIPTFELWLKDIFQFQPQLRQNEYLVALSRKKLSGQIRASGTLSNLRIPQAKLRWGGSTAINASGTIQNPMDVEKIQFDFPNFRMLSTRNDIIQFIDEKALGIKLPEKLVLAGTFSGEPDDMIANFNLETSAGDIEFTGGFTNEGIIAYDANLQVTELELGNIFQNESFGKLTLNLTSSGSGATLSELDAVLDANIESFAFNGYDINNIPINGEIKDGQGKIFSEYADENLEMELETFVQLDTVASTFIADFNIIGANLQALGIANRDIRTAFHMLAMFNGDLQNYQANLNVNDAVAVYDNQTYLIGDVDVHAYVLPDSTNVDVNNRILQLQLSSNANPMATIKGFQRHLDNYITDVIRTDTVENPVELRLRAHIANSPALSKVILPDLEELDSVSIKVDFSETERDLVAAIELPYINYNEMEVDSLFFYVNSDKDSLNFDFGMNAFTAAPLAIKETHLLGKLSAKKYFLDFKSSYNGEQLVNVLSEISKNDSIFRIHLNPEGLILNRKKWSVPENNAILLSGNSLEFSDFQLSRNEQLFDFSNDMPEAEKEHIGIIFQNFNLQSLLSYFNPDRLLMAGNMDGDFIVEEPFGSTGLIADLEIEDFSVMAVPLGNLSLDAEAIGTREYSLDLALNDGNVDMDLTGSYIAQETSALLDLKLDLHELKMQAVEDFLPEEVTNTSGSISGQMRVGGTVKEPDYQGNFHFNNSEFTVAKLNAAFTFPDENIRIDSAGVYLEDFEILDKNKNRMIVDGSIFTENLFNPSFDLQLSANDFTAVNSTEEDFDLFYGTATFDAEAHLTGDLNVPVLDLRLDVGPNTHVTYVIPEAELNIVERDGIVIFVNRENPDDILTQTPEEESVTITGFEVNSVISVDEDAIFNIVLDRETGDNFQVAGEGDFNFNVYPNGRTTLSGRYEMSDGYYEMSLYGLVNRRFEIAPGSSITWAGDPFNASLDIRAIYKVETSASSLMAAQTSGASAGVSGRFRQELPFLVYLNIEGDLMQPKISFNLDMPESEQGAIGGQVYGRIQQLNQQENELNKQVFSLLVMNRFFPQSMTDGSTGGTLTIARDNLNQALSDQLNMFSSQVLGDSGVELNFAVDSFTDYQGESPQERTQLDITAEKSLMNDRLIVRVGSEVDIQGSAQTPGETNPIIGNVSIEYLLSEEGRFRLKAFRKNQYENVIDGQLIVSGIALIFIEEFNKFKELWTKAVVEELNKNEEK